MRVVHRISTGQFEYVEVEQDSKEIALAEPFEVTIKRRHDDLINAFRPKQVSGIPDKEYNQFIDAMLLGEPNHVQVWEKLSANQKEAAQIIKKSLKRLEARENKQD